MNRIILKNIMLVSAILIALTLISSSSMSITLSNISKPEKLDFIEIEEEILNGLAPRNGDYIPQVSVKNNNKQSLSIEPITDEMYGYIVNGGQEGPCWFYIADPGTIEEIAPTASDDFIAGGTWTCEEVWYGCEYNTGGLWTINPDNGDMVNIGGGGTSCNGLAWDPGYNRLYGASNTHLIEYDPETGEQETIGSFGLSGKTIIAIAIHNIGICYAWDVLFSGSSTLYTIDLETGEATEVGSMEQNLCYAQDGAFDWDTGILYLTAYTDHGFLAEVDETTAELTVLGDFQGGAQITGSIFRSCAHGPEHDMALQKIDYPRTGSAGPDMKMQATVRNTGYCTEIFDAQMEIIGNQTGSLLLEEDFSGTFPPAGWDTGSWVQCNSSCCHESPCACLPSYQGQQYIWGNITSKPVDASGNKSCTLTYYSCWDMLYPQYCNFYVKFRRNESSPWKDVTPWDNPLGEGFESDYYQIDIHSFNSSEGCGEALQIKWEFLGYYYYYNSVCLDTVSLVAIDGYYEYAELVEDITLDPWEKMQIEFPSWTPSHWQDPEYENSWVDYTVYAFTIFEGDQNPSNDNKYKFIELYFGFFHDVGVSDVSCPESGPAQTFPVTGHIKNFGQYDESGFNSYLGIAELDIDNPVELLTEDFSESTFPPDDWTTTHNNWKYSSTNYAGGTTGEARFCYSPQSTDTFRLFTPAIDTSEYGAIEVGFKHYVDHYTTPYTLKLETSEDGVNWNVLWEIEPTVDIGPETISIFMDNIGSNTYVSWTFEGNSWNINNWYVDDIIIKGYSLLAPEYEDNVIIYEVKPGEELAVEFSGWTPEFLQYETTGIKKYMVKSWTDMQDPEDQNQDNDLFNSLITLDFFHDVGIKNISSPSNPRNGFVKSKTFTLPLPELYIMPGHENIDVNVVNNGTFPELDLTCYAEIWEFITSENGTLVYEDEIADIDLEEPVGGTKLLNFEDYIFAYEGVYGLYLDLPLEIDDYPENNYDKLIIGVDSSPPFSWIEEMVPPEPDGENGWYVSDIKLTICAKDPNIAPGIPGSGVRGIFIRTSGGSSHFFIGDCVTTILCPDDDEDIIVEWWAIDNVGHHEENHHTFTIDIDQISPAIDLTYKVTGGNSKKGWDLLFTATATDVTSGMDRVEFYLNGGLQSVVSGSGPEYHWSFIYHGGLNIDIVAVAYDIAGNHASDIVENPKPASYNYNSQSLKQHSQILKSSYFMQNLYREYFLSRGN